MSTMRESSVLFSLNQLMKLEQQRLREEEEAARMRALAEAEARRERERRAREEEAARLQAEEARRRAEEEQRREIEARLEAIRLAELERVRVEAERRERLAVMEQANLHERKLAELAADTQKKRLKRILVVGGALVATVFSGAFGVYFGHVQPEAERLHQQELADLATRDAELGRLKAEYEQAVARAEKAAQDLAQAKDSAHRLRAAKAAGDAKRAADDAKKRFVAGPLTNPLTRKDKDPGCVCADPHDPLCGCLNH